MQILIPFYQAYNIFFLLYDNNSSKIISYPFEKLELIVFIRKKENITYANKVSQK